MKIAIVSICLFVAVMAEEKYNSNLGGDFNVKDVLNNERLLLNYTKCLLDKGPCTPEVKQLKETLPEALATRCAKCTDEQKEVGKKLASELKRTHPDIWKQLVSKYDPQGKYQDAFKDFLKA